LIVPEDAVSLSIGPHEAAFTTTHSHDSQLSIVYKENEVHQIQTTLTLAYTGMVESP